MFNYASVRLTFVCLRCIVRLGSTGVRLRSICERRGCVKLRRCVNLAMSTFNLGNMLNKSALLGRGGPRTGTASFFASDSLDS